MKNISQKQDNFIEILFLILSGITFFLLLPLFFIWIGSFFDNGYGYMMGYYSWDIGTLFWVWALCLLIFLGLFLFFYGLVGLLTKDNEMKKKNEHHPYFFWFIALFLIILCFLPLSFFFLWIIFPIFLLGILLGLMFSKKDDKIPNIDTKDNDGNKE